MAENAESLFKLRCDMRVRNQQCTGSACDSGAEVIQDVLDKRASEVFRAFSDERGVATTSLRGAALVLGFTCQLDVSTGTCKPQLTRTEVRPWVPELSGSAD